MKKILSLLLLAALTSCTYGVRRTNYTPVSDTSGNCPIVFTKAKPASTGNDRLGEVKLKDNGFTTKCSEQEALAFLQKEACSLGANLVYIEKDSRPNVISTCYRCTAQFYRVDNPQAFAMDDYRELEVAQRVIQDERNKHWYLIGSILIGFATAIILL